MKKEYIQARRDAHAADMARNQANITRTKEEIAKAQEQLGYYDREFHTLNGAIQTCDALLNEIHEGESKSAEAGSNLLDFKTGDLDAIARQVADKEDRSR